VDIDDQRALVEKARGGDADAWESLYRNVYPRLRAYAARHGGADAAEDLVNETMARAVAAMGKFQWQSAGFDAWLFGILRRVCAEHHRHNRRRQDRDVRYGPSLDGDQPTDHFDLIEEQERVRRAFEQLKPAERELLELRVMAGLSADQVGELLGKQPGAIRTAQSRAVAQLRRLMERDQ
jgi:RNA polymerase sigma-70 factor (ECF subfamily)